MKISKNIVALIERKLYENDLNLSEESELFLSHINDDFYCVFTRKNGYGNFFSEDSNPKLNSFFRKMASMLLSDELNLEGCFDYERSIKNEYKTIKDKANNYLSSSLNFILIRCYKNKIEPLSFFTYINGYIWNVCTDSKNRGEGYMTILFSHFMKLLKLGEFKDDIKLYDNNLSLNLLRTNPQFEETKKFYHENGFILKDDLADKIIMNKNVTI
jgi:hypothetical protein